MKIIMSIFEEVGIKCFKTLKIYVGGVPVDSL